MCTAVFMIIAVELGDTQVVKFLVLKKKKQTHNRIYNITEWVVCSKNIFDILTVAHCNWLCAVALPG